jgi:hypothetical protein
MKTKNNLASAYLREGKYRLAFEYYRQVLNESRMYFDQQCSTGDNSMIVTAMKNIGRLIS